MKKFIAAAALSLFMFESTAQIPKIALIEHFTQASCGPCASQNPAMYSELSTFGAANYNKVTYQVSWPGFDPMNLEYPAGPNDRRNFYGVTGVPNANINGGAVALPGTAITSSTLGSAASLTTPYDIDVVQSWTTSGVLTVDVTLTNTTAAPISGADKLHLVMVENEIIFSSAPGSNGETAFFSVAREMYNASTGASTTSGLAIGSIPANGTLTYSHTFASLPSYIRNFNKISFIAFLQNDGTKEVFQSGHSIAGGVTGISPSATSASTSPSGFCNYDFTPAIEITNDGTSAITSAEVQYSLNGGTALTETYSGSLAQGQSTTISFPIVQLTGGESTVSYTVNSVNSGAFIIAPSNLVIADEVYLKLSTTSSATPVSEGFTGYTPISTPSPTGVLADNPDNIDAFLIDASATPIAANLGGFGLSDGCFFWDFFTISSGDKSKLIWDKMDLTGSENTFITFDRAYAQYDASSNDMLKVSVSTDCGITWTSVYEKSGTLLATGPISTGRFFPESAQWATDTVQIGDYDNMDDIIFNFEGISAYGNSLLIDNIKLLNDATSSITTNSILNNEMSVYPNPSNSVVNVEFELQNENDVTVSIMNTVGQTVASNNLGSVSGVQATQIDVSSFESGMYIVRVKTANGEQTKRISVIK